MMNNEIEKLIKDLVCRSTGISDAVRYEQFGETQYLESDSFSEIPLGGDWLFNKASDTEAKILLEAFLANKLKIGPDLNCEMARLLAEKGNLVWSLVSEKIDESDWSSYGAPSLLLAGLHFLPDLTKRAKELLDIVPEDLRDGLFLSIWKAGDKTLNGALLEHFEKWVSEPDWGEASGEIVWLERFLSKWISNEIFPIERLMPLITWYFKHKFRCL